MFSIHPSKSSKGLILNRVTEEGAVEGLVAEGSCSFDQPGSGDPRVFNRAVCGAFVGSQDERVPLMPLDESSPAEQSAAGGLYRSINITDRTDTLLTSSLRARAWETPVSGRQRDRTARAADSPLGDSAGSQGGRTIGPVICDGK